MRLFLAAVALLFGLAGALPVSAQESQPAQALHVGGSVVPTRPQQCALRAMHALAVQEQFPFATIREDGHVLAWNDRISVLVLIFPHQDSSTLHIVLTAGRDGKEADRLRNVVRERIASPSNAPDTTPTLVYDESALDSKAPWIHYLVQPKPAVSTLKYYQPVTSLLLEKRGFQVMNANNNLMLGGDINRVVALFAVPGKSAVSVNLGTVVADEDRAAADRLCEQFFNGVQKLLYD